MATIHGVVHGKMIELSESPGLPDGQRVVVQLEPATELLSEVPAGPKMQISEGLAKIYAVLGERYDSGHTDTAERHNEHQP